MQADGIQLYLDLKSVMERFKVSASSVYTWISCGQFPAPKKFGRSSRWKLSELEAWEAAQPQRVDREGTAGRLQKSETAILPAKKTEKAILSKGIRERLGKIRRS